MHYVTAHKGQISSARYASAIPPQIDWSGLACSQQPLHVHLSNLSTEHGTNALLALFVLK